MKGLTRILIRHVAAAAGIALLLLALNLAVLIGWAYTGKQEQVWNSSVSQISSGLTKRNGEFVLSGSAEDVLRKGFQWAMLLDDDGQVIWENNLPDSLPRRYTVPETASFTRWYLQNYPVMVWRHTDGLLVLGGTKGSQWKTQVVLPQSVMEHTPAWLLGAIFVNAAAALLLAMFVGLRLYHTLKPVVSGIADLADGKPVAIQEKGIFGDLAAQLNQTSAKLASQDEMLRRRDTTRTAWIAGVSHDIRTPLSLVMGYASELEEEPALPDPLQEKAAVIRAQSEKIRTLVSDLNLASKLEYSMQPLTKAEFYPAELLRSVVSDFLNCGLDNRFSVRLTISPEAQKVRLTGDAQLLRRALFNLVDNSVRHNPEGCAVSAAMEVDTQLCVLRVADDGKGFPEETLETLRWEKPAEELHTHGLGLTIVRQIVRLHRGVVRFENLAGGGCECVIQLPVISVQ